MRAAPGVLAVKIEFENERAIVGTDGEQAAKTDEMLKALEAIGYSGRIMTE